MPNIVSPEPGRIGLRLGVAVKLAGEVLLRRKKVSDALREYEKTIDNIRWEKRMDGWRQY
jgi:hypothetical protein